MSWHEIYDEETLAVGDHWTKPKIPLRDGKTVHAFEYAVTGSGNVTITPYTSISGEHFISNGAKVSGVVETSGPDSDGKDSIPLRLKPAEFIYFKVTVAGAEVALTLWFTQK